MKRTRSLLFAALLFIASGGLPTSAISAATVSVTILPGPLAITDMSAVLTDTPATGADGAQILDTTCTVGVTDATGKKAGWHIDAALGPLTTSEGTPIPVLTAIVTRARVIGLTGSSPRGVLAYPRALRMGGDTIFSATENSGMGKSSLAFDIEITVPAYAATTAPLITTLSVTIATSP